MYISIITSTTHSRIIVGYQQRVNIMNWNFKKKCILIIYSKQKKCNSIIYETAMYLKFTRAILDASIKQLVTAYIQGVLPLKKKNQFLFITWQPYFQLFLLLFLCFIVQRMHLVLENADASRCNHSFLLSYICIQISAQFFALQIYKKYLIH